jgi:hypothetical protein
MNAQPLPDYRAFLEAKIPTAAAAGLEIAEADVHPWLKPHCRAIVPWAVRGGRRAIFAAFGLHKTSMQLEILRQILRCEAGAGLIVLPLGVRQEFRRDAERLGLRTKFIRSAEEIEHGDPDLVHLTNYETVRDGKLDPALFTVASLDEAAVLRGFGGTKTFREFMRLFAGVKYRFVATATPSPNEYIELLAYAAFLDIMDVGQAKTRFFKRNSEEADQLTIHPHKEREFWLWVASWAIFIQKPSDLGFSDDGYTLPPIDIRWHEVPTDHSAAGAERDGQGKLFRNAAIGVSTAAREKRDSLSARIAKMMELRAEDPAAHRLIWHDLEAERQAIEAAAPEIITVYGTQEIDERERATIGFSEGTIAELAGKPVMLGVGSNFQYHCAWEIFLGIGFKFHDFIQGLHRLVRFGQPRQVRVDLIYSEAERDIRRILEEKWRGHEALVARMGEIIREYGLGDAARAMQRSIGVVRAEIKGEAWRIVHNDCVEEARAMPAASVGLIVTSIPFATQYEYTPSYNDFGHTDDNAHFWRQMDFLAPELLRVLQPGRVMAVHVKDRIVPGGMTGLGFQTVAAFHAEAIFHYQRHGFAFLGMRTITTDVVRENNQTYRLGWTEQCKDGSRMGPGMSEYLLLFRRPPTDCSNGYADEPVVKDKPLCDDHGEPAPFDARRNWKRPVPGTGYSRARWQMDAHGYWKSSGNRLLTPDELRGLPHDQLYKLWRDRSLYTVYDHEEHVGIAEELDHLQRLPATFMLLPPHSADEAVWTDIARMRTLNGAQAAAGREMHLCPLQFDIVDRVIVQHSMPGEVVFDPFAGIGTVPFCAIKLGRQGLGVELSETYFREAARHCEAAEREASVPTLFALLDGEEAA